MQSFGMHAPLSNICLDFNNISFIFVPDFCAINHPRKASSYLYVILQCSVSTKFFSIIQSLSDSRKKMMWWLWSYGAGTYGDMLTHSPCARGRSFFVQQQPTLALLSCGCARSAYDHADPKTLPTWPSGWSASALFLKGRLKVSVCLWLLPSFYRKPMTLEYSNFKTLCHALTTKTYNLRFFESLSLYLWLWKKKNQPVEF